MPFTTQEGIVKIAVVRSRTAGYHSWQFINDSVSEGRSMGFTVDTFLLEDEQRCMGLLDRIVRADYDGLIFSCVVKELKCETILYALDNGLKIVTFGMFPSLGCFRNADLSGLTITNINHEKLARISLDYIVSGFGGNGRPPRVIRILNGGAPCLDTYQRVYGEFLEKGMIEEAAFLSPANSKNVRNDTKETLAEILRNIPYGSADVIWAPGIRFAKGSLDALKKSGRDDIKMVSIGITNETLRLMSANPDLWLATAAVDPSIIGVVNMRLLAAKLAGEETPVAFLFSPQIIEAAGLNMGANLANIAAMVPGWGQAAGLFDHYKWMEKLKTTGRIYPHLSPGAGH